MRKHNFLKETKSAAIDISLAKEPPHILVRNLWVVMAGCSKKEWQMGLMLIGNMSKTGSVSISRKFYTEIIKPDFRLTYPDFLRVVNTLIDRGLLIKGTPTWVRVNPEYVKPGGME